MQNRDDLYAFCIIQKSGGISLRYSTDSGSKFHCRPSLIFLFWPYGTLLSPYGKTPGLFHKISGFSTKRLFFFWRWKSNSKTFKFWNKKDLVCKLQKKLVKSLNFKSLLNISIKNVIPEIYIQFFWTILSHFGCNFDVKTSKHISKLFLREQNVWRSQLWHAVQKALFVLIFFHVALQLCPKKTKFNSLT